MKQKTPNINSVRQHTRLELLKQAPLKNVICQRVLWFTRWLHLGLFSSLKLWLIDHLNCDNFNGKKYPRTCASMETSIIPPYLRINESVLLVWVSDLLLLPLQNVVLNREKKKQKKTIIIDTKQGYLAEATTSYIIHIAEFCPWPCKKKTPDTNRMDFIINPGSKKNMFLWYMILLNILWKKKPKQYVGVPYPQAARPPPSRNNERSPHLTCFSFCFSRPVAASSAL